MSTNKRAIGAYGERLVEDDLVKNGYRILRKNYRFHRLGEIDIIAKGDDGIHFIEVKSRKNNDFGTPAEAVNAEKCKTIQKVAQMFIKYELNNHFVINDLAIHFDVAEVDLRYNKINYLIDAF